METVSTYIPGTETTRKIIGFLRFPVGWKYGTGVPAAPLTARRALVITQAATRSGLETDAFLGIDGEIRVGVYRRFIYHQFTIDEEGFVEYVREESGNEVQRIPQLRLEHALSILETFELELWLSSVSSTATTMTPREDVSKILHSRLPDAVRVFRSLSGIAPFELALQSVDT
jgi:hypothetical protein